MRILWAFFLRPPAWPKEVEPLMDATPAPLTVEVRLLPDPCLWAWEIRDRDHGGVIDNSWDSEWTAYDSAEEAYRAGRRRLTHLTADRP